MPYISLLLLVQLMGTCYSLTFRNYKKKEKAVEKLINTDYKMVNPSGFFVIPSGTLTVFY